jgi:hypothetical protein
LKGNKRRWAPGAVAVLMRRNFPDPGAISAPASASSRANAGPAVRPVVAARHTDRRPTAKLRPHAPQRCSVHEAVRRELSRLPQGNAIARRKHISNRSLRPPTPRLSQRRGDRETGTANSRAVTLEQRNVTGASGWALTLYRATSPGTASHDSQSFCLGPTARQRVT